MSLVEVDIENNVLFVVHVVGAKLLSSLHCIAIILDNIGDFQPISRDTDDNGETNKCWWTNKRG